MPKYKITVSKDQKKYTIVYEAETEKIAKDRVHKEGYSILSVSELKNETIGNEIIFEIIKDSETKKGKVISDDIFKTYLKLKDGLGYDIQKLYHKTDENKSLEEKQKILKNLEEQYIFYEKINKKELKQQREIKEEKEVKIVNADAKIDDFYMKKELEETYKLIDFVLDKLRNIIESENELKTEKKEKFRTIYNSIVKIKTSTNIAKLKEIGELALLRIGEIELEKLEKTKTKKSKELLSETNSLLKQIGSSKKFIEKEKDIKYLLGKFTKQINDFFLSFKNKKQVKIEDIIVVDKTSNTFLKNALLLSKYKEKLKENTIEIIKNFYLFFSFIENEKKDNLIIRRSVIKQNIKLLDMKINGKTFSYTKIVKGYDTFLGAMLYLFSLSKNYLYIVIFIYSILFLSLLNLDFFSISSNIIDFNFYGLLYFLLIILIYFFFSLSRGFITLILNFVILFFLIIFGVVNF